MTEINFDYVVETLKRFTMSTAPFNESEIESNLIRFLKARHLPAISQVSVKNGRYDVLIGRIVIELKVRGQRSVAEQLDRYSPNATGIILLCWKASKPTRILFQLEKQTAKIPVELIEMNRNSDIV